MPANDDVQVLYNNIALQSQYYSSLNDIGPNVITQLNQVFTGKTVPLFWSDYITWPGGTTFGENPNDVKAVPYLMPSSPTDRCANITPYTLHGPPAIPGACPGGTWSTVPSDSRDAFWNNASIEKIQYQHNIGSNAYFRIYGYAFYSDWLQTSPLSFGSGQLIGFGVTSYDYELNSHTRGLAFSFADQINSSNLVTFDANYTTATTNRYNNTNFNNTPSTIATNLTNGAQCFAWKTGRVYPGGQVYQAGQPAPCNSSLTSGTFLRPEPAQASAGANWEITYTGNSGFVNNVIPNFTTFALEDRWNPTDKLDVDLGLRDEIYSYDLANTSNDGQNFWFLAGQREFCYNPATLSPYFIPCQAGERVAAHAVHRIRLPRRQLDSGASRADGASRREKRRPAAEQQLQPDADRLRVYAPAGRHVHGQSRHGAALLGRAFRARARDLPSAVQLEGQQSRLRALPSVLAVRLHDSKTRSARAVFRQLRRFVRTALQGHRHVDQTDAVLSLRHQSSLLDIGLPFGLTGGLNSGVERVSGVELEFTKGDFDKDGLSFLVSYTYTNAAEKWANYPGTGLNPIDPYNQDIANFNGLTKAGGGSKCYENDRSATSIPTHAACN